MRSWRPCSARYGDLELEDILDVLAFFLMQGTLLILESNLLKGLES